MFGGAGVALHLQLSQLVLGQVPDKEPKLPPKPVADPLKDDPDVSANFKRMTDLRGKGMRDLNSYATGGKDNSDEPLPTKGPKGEQIRVGDKKDPFYTQGSTYRSHADNYFKAFERLEAAAKGVFPPPGGFAPDAGAVYGDIGWGTDNQGIKQRREKWVTDRLLEFDRASDGAASQVTSMSRTLSKNEAWRRTRDTPGPQEKEFSEAREKTREALKKALEARYDSDRATWVAYETKRQRTEIATLTVEAAGSPVYTAPEKPQSPLAVQNGDVWVIKKDGVEVHLRRNKVSGNWEWAMPVDGKVADEAWKPALAQIPFDPKAKKEALAVHAAVNAELSYLAKPQVSHYVVRRGADTVFLQFVKDDGANGGSWQWQKGGGAVDKDAWKPLTNTTDISEAGIKDLFTKVLARQATPVTELTARRNEVVKEYSNALNEERKRGVDIVLPTGDQPSVMGFKKTKVDLGSGNVVDGWSISEGGFEAQVFRTRPDGPLFMRSRQRIDVLESKPGDKPEKWKSSTTPWSAPTALPGGLPTAIPVGTDKNNGKNPAYEGQVAVMNKLKLLNGIANATDLPGARAINERAEGNLAYYHNRGPSYDPGENLLRLCFGAVDAAPEYGPGVLRATVNGKERLFRRLAASSDGTRYAVGSAEGFGQWEYADVPPAPKEKETAKSPEWKSVFNDVTKNGSRDLGAPGELLNRFKYSEPWERERIHPMVWADYAEPAPGSAERKKLLAGFGSGFLKAVPGTTESGGVYTLKIPGADVTPRPQAKVSADKWVVSLDDGKTWVVAGETGSVLIGNSPTAQRYNYVLTVLGEFNRGVEFAPPPPPLTPKK